MAETKFFLLADKAVSFIELDGNKYVDVHSGTVRTFHSSYKTLMKNEPLKQESCVLINNRDIEIRASVQYADKIDAWLEYPQEFINLINSAYMWTPAMPLSLFQVVYDRQTVRSFDRDGVSTEKKIKTNYIKEVLTDQVVDVDSFPLDEVFYFSYRNLDINRIREALYTKQIADISEILCKEDIRNFRTMWSFADMEEDEEFGFDSGTDLGNLVKPSFISLAIEALPEIPNPAGESMQVFYSGLFGAMARDGRTHHSDLMGLETRNFIREFAKKL
ncbi:hypothetical protein [Vibrio phage BONAISHI]|nr:hypothetical protein [Vibrio phage BONAISHI]